MNLQVKNRHFMLFVLLAIIILRYSRLYDIAVLLFSFVTSLFKSNSQTPLLFSLSLADNFISVILIFALLIYLAAAGKRLPVLNRKLNLTSSVIILLLTFFIFSPVVSTSDPDYQGNIGITKLLPPFSVVKTLVPSGQTEYISLRNRLQNEPVIYIDSIKNEGKEYYYYQKGIKKKAGPGEIRFNGGIPVVDSRLFILGTDEFGRDIFSRLVYGTRISMIVGLGAVIIAFILGIGLGFLAGYSRWFFDTLLNRFTDMFLSIPVIFLIILILTFFGNSIFTIIFILGFSGWMSLFKIVRSEVISIKQKDYFITAVNIGLPQRQLLLKEILPVIIAPVVVNLIFQYGNVILAEAALSYLGLGTGLNYPSWGGMIEAGQEYLSQAWWMILFPGLALILTLFTANNLGRELNQFYNPRVNK